MAQTETRALLFAWRKTLTVETGLFYHSRARGIEFRCHMLVELNLTRLPHLVIATLQACQQNISRGKAENKPKSSHTYTME
jgi:hypothetical protein